MKIAALTPTGVSQVTISSPLLEMPVSSLLLAQAVRVFMSRQRQATSKTKTRSDVNRTKKKWYKQKHTGGARHGARTPNIFVGGGVSHGPNGLQNFWMELNAQMKRQAVGMAIAAQADRLVIADLAQTAKEFRKALTSLNSERILVITPASDISVVKAIGNMGNVQVTAADRVNMVDILNATHVVLNEASFKSLETRVGVAAKTTKTVKTATADKAAAVKTVAQAPVKAKKTTKKVTKTA